MTIFLVWVFTSVSLTIIGWWFPIVGVKEVIEFTIWLEFVIKCGLFYDIVDCAGPNLKVDYLKKIQLIS